MYDKIKELINSSDLITITKKRACALIDYAVEIQNENLKDIELIQQVSGDKYIATIELSNEDVKVYTVHGKRELDVKCPYRIIYKQNDAWKNCNFVLPNLDAAILYYLQHKYLGFNSEFAGFAMKMLEMPNID